MSTSQAAREGHALAFANSASRFIEAPIRAYRSLATGRMLPSSSTDIHQTQGDEHGTAATLKAAIDGKQISRPDELQDFDRTAVHRLRAATAGYCARPIFKVHLVAPGQNWSFPQASEVIRTYISLARGRCEAVDRYPWSGD